MVISEIDRIRDHLNNLYDEWEKILYPDGRKTDSAEIKVSIGCKTSGYYVSNNLICIYIPDGNLEDFKARIGTLNTHSGKWNRPVNETELLHEMLHEMQYKELTKTSEEGKELFKKHQHRFSGPGHDDKFFSAVVEAALLLGHDPEWFVQQL